jgi:hypothetical protein
MNNALRIALVAVLAGVALAAARGGLASEKLARDSGAACTDCHDKPGSKLLTDRGKYFEMKRSLDGYDALAASFGRCTACHVRAPGSAKLTRKGRQFADIVKDMEGLKRWMEERHPTAPPK